MGNLWDNYIYENEQDIRQKEEAHKTYNLDTPDLDIMETY